MKEFFNLIETNSAYIILALAILVVDYLRSE